MKKSIIITAVCYLLFEVMFYFSIAFSILKINPSYWSDTAREGFAFVSMSAFIIAVIICCAIAMKQNKLQDENYKNKISNGGEM